VSFATRSPAELRILQVIPSLWMGGLERVATRLTLGLRERVAHVAVATAGGDPFTDVLRDERVRLYRIVRPYPKPLHLAAASAQLVRVLRRERPDVIHAHNPGAAVAASVARRLARSHAAIVSTYHGVPPDQAARAARVLARSSDLVVAVAPAATRTLVELGLPEERSATVLNAVEPQPSRPAEDVRREFDAADSELVVTVGRYTEQKNHHVLLDALALLAPERPRLRALLVGVGELEEDLVLRTTELDLEGVVTITGERNDAIDITAAADVFALSSDWEGLPLALLEAMALGIPVVATAVNGVPDAISDGDNGLLVPRRDPQALAQALSRVLDDDELRRRLGSRARAWAEAACSEAAMTSGYLGVYASAFERRRRSGVNPS